MKKDDPDRKMAKDIWAGIEDDHGGVFSVDAHLAIELIHNGLVTAYNAGFRDGKNTGKAANKDIFYNGYRMACREFWQTALAEGHKRDKELGLCEPSIVKCLLVNEEISLSRAAELLQISIVEMRERAKEWLNPKT